MHLTMISLTSSMTRSTRALLLAPVLLAVVACSGGKVGDSESDSETEATATATATATTTTGTATDPSATDTDTDTATTGVNPDPCMQVPEGGSCDAAFEKWAFDPVSGRCYSWIYGGCDGVVPFDDLDSCQSQCEPCEAFFDDQTPAPSFEATPMTIRNNGAEGVWVQAYTPSGDALGYREQVIELAPYGGGEPLVTAPNWCDFPCSAFENEQCAAGCSDGGPPPEPIFVAPGGAYTIEWSGQHFAPIEVPDRCLPRACADGLTCDRWRDATFQSGFEARARVSTAILCEGMGCTCTPNADGWCQLGPDPIGAALDMPMTIATDLSVPGLAVELVVGP